MKKIYIEISDICGLKCDFCPAPKGVRGVMDLATFKKAACEARQFTRLIALHILGDPLQVENLSKYLQIAKEANLSVEITTSGANLSDFDLLLKAPIKQVNFSLDAIRELKNAPFLMRRICDFCAYKVQKKSEIFINLRIQKRAENRGIIEFLAQNLGNSQNLQGGWLLRNARKSFGLPRRFCESARNDDSFLDSANLQNLAQNRIKLGNKIIIDFRDVFKWQVDSAILLQRGWLLRNARKSFGLPRSLALARNDNFNRFAESNADSANFLDSALSTLSTNETNSSIFDESQRVASEAKQKSGLCSHEREDRTDEFIDEASGKLPDLSHPTGCERSEAKTDAEFGTCLALKTHLGILSDGTIIPCCIDTSGNLALGNIKEISLDSALKSARAQKMLQGFRENRLIEPFCQRCDYKNRFT